jgi:hypothetical protein
MEATGAVAEWVVAAASAQFSASVKVSVLK